jgi:hypothetical protein
MDLGMLLILIGNVILEVVGGGKFGKEANRVRVEISRCGLELDRRPRNNF